MRRTVTVILLLFILWITGVALAGHRHGRMGSTVGVRGSVRMERHYFAPFAAYDISFPAPVLVISPYSPWYYVTPAVVVTSTYFCVFQNDGFVSRIGLLDHLSGAHKIPLDAAASFCPDRVGRCVFPSY